MRWEVEFTEVFGTWWDSLPYPHSSDVKGARHGNMRELRVQHKGEPYRVLYAFDPRRTALLLIGGKKTGDDRWYTKNVPKADKIYDKHLKELEKRRRRS
ncbi:MAG: type II toxin-antitoxin system RelE/ParE family toxin [Desulfobacteria bacterium]